MRRFCIALPLLALECTAGPARNTRAQAAVPACLPAGAGSDRYVDILQGWLTSSDTANVSWRRRMALDATRPDSVTLVTDDRTCERASVAVDAVRRRPASGRPVYVFRFGPYFAVPDPARDGAHYNTIHLFDESFAPRDQLGY